MNELGIEEEESRGILSLLSHNIVGDQNTNMGNYKKKVNYKNRRHLCGLVEKPTSTTELELYFLQSHLGFTNDIRLHILNKYSF